MGKSVFNAISEIINQAEDMCAFSVDFSDDSYDIQSSGRMAALVDENSNPLEQFCYNRRIHESDGAVITAFCRDLLGSKNNPIYESRYGISFRANLSENAEDNTAEYSWLILTIAIDRDEELRARCIVGHLRIMNHAEMLNKTIIDSFTNDKHPRVFASRAQAIVSDESRKSAIVQFDIEKFKLINTAYGEEKGTEILNFIVNGMASICNERQVCLRLSADVFMIAVAYDDISEIEELIEKISERLGHYQNINYKLVFGINIITDRTLSLRKQGDRAAMARQSIKGNALTNVCYYNDTQENKLVSRKFIEDRMYYALENEEFAMFLQPKYSISTAGIVGAEALVRWIHPERGMLSPAEFIPVFEADGFITMLDEYIWEQACKALRRWMDMGYTPIPISVNISRVHLVDDKFIDVLDGLIAKYDIPKNLLETEITESLENAGDTAAIKKLKERGYMLLMDDFGSGYSSLNMLKNTPFDVIKIDRDFFSEFMLSDRGKKIISHTISMSKDIGLDMVAEGVETREQAEFLEMCGCDVAQGFFYSKPVCLEEFEKLAFFGADNEKDMRLEA
ncbi:MAG: GGDEF domain-containing phosphodiesterase [Oscillospiraceae bacterium]|nr:GGDEF domain-containing phosphodiesterase [Oscillospiraceae bacterium]